MRRVCKSGRSHEGTKVTRRSAWISSCVLRAFVAVQSSLERESGWHRPSDELLDVLHRIEPAGPMIAAGGVEAVAVVERVFGAVFAEELFDPAACQKRVVARAASIN